MLTSAGKKTVARQFIALVSPKLLRIITRSA
ncbi:hypothetical protein ROE7235_03811 [Roseibaca ekhonensis]|uniref:Uncharacterized protein n=1 Tax=Roseinatronobacter ekhonensis TaxID=254356 RepID=A0A3B0MCZ0_9RHOB|nr:hypothetical protein ROE7235_03504 [Roseibaca ekhonensis]SUZ34030.1 hypothetical protein ROE7235_03811 [Roseibaca ekhonensis]